MHCAAFFTASVVWAAPWLPVLYACLIQTLFVLLWLGLAGALMALWLAIPRVRAFCDAHLLDPQQQVRDGALYELDRRIQAYLKEVNRRRPITLQRVRGGGRHVLADL